MRALRSRLQRHKLPLLVVVGIMILGAFVWMRDGRLLTILAPGTTSVALEAESGSLTAPATIGSDATASGGQFVQFGSVPPPTTFQPSAPYYATFFYPWSQNPNTDGIWSYWNDNGHTPPQNWFSNYLPDPNPSAFDPTNELYSSNNYNIFKWQMTKLAEAKQEVGISSWWGQGHKSDVSFKNIVTDLMKRSDNPYPNFRWSIYYEKEGTADPSLTEIVSDLNYIKINYASQPSFLQIGGKPVIFVYGGASDTSTYASKWAQARAQTGFYVVLKVFSGYKTDPNQPDSWHQYSPAARSDSQSPYSYAVSPGFWLNGEATPRLVRDLTSFRSAISSMVAANVTWKLTATWNEWGEGSSVEPGEEVNQTTSGSTTPNPSGAPFKNQYVDALNQLLPVFEGGTGL